MAEPGMVVQNIGPVTAYAYAVAGGYKGTLEQFKADLAKLAGNVTQVREDKEAAEASAKNAAVSETNAKTAETNAAQSAAASAESARTAEAAADRSVNGGAYIVMSVGEDGNLYMEKTDNVEGIDLSLDENGNLIMEVNVNG